MELWNINCWDLCGNKAGSCSACGANGYCCRYDYGDCPSTILNVKNDENYGHGCVSNVESPVNSPVSHYYDYGLTTSTWYNIKAEYKASGSLCTSTFYVGGTLRWSQTDHECIFLDGEPNIYIAGSYSSVFSGYVDEIKFEWL